MQVEAEDNAHVLIDFGDGRLAVVTTGFTMQKYRSPAIELYGTDGRRCSCSATTGRPRATSCGATAHGAWEVHAETDPAWPWTDGLRHLVDCIADGPRAGDPARARLPRARDHARRAGRRRRRPRARHHEPLPRARLRVAAGRGRRPPPRPRPERQPCDDLQPEPAPDVRRPDRDPVRVRHPPRLGRRRGGRGGRLDLRVDRQDPLPRVRPAGRTAPSGTRASS